MRKKKTAILFAVLVILLTGCSADTDISTEDSTKEGADAQAIDTATESSITEAYEAESDGEADGTYVKLNGEYYELIDEIAHGIENGFSENEIDELGISPLFGLNIDFSDYGYRIMDVDGNGVDELIIGKNGSGAWDGVIYDMYTMSDEKMVSVICGWDRNRYYLCENGLFANEGSSGADSSSYGYYSYADGKLELVEASEEVIDSSQYRTMNFVPFPTGDLTTYYERITLDMLDDCEAEADDTYPYDMVSFYNAPLILLNRFNEQIRLYGIRVDDKTAMILYVNGEKVLLNYYFWNNYMYAPALNACDWDGDGEDEIIISHVKLAGTGVHIDELLVCDYRDAWNIYAYEDYPQDMESLIAYQYDESSNSITFSSKEDGTVLSEVKLPEWTSEYPYAGTVYFTGLVVRFDAETLQMEVTPGIELENSMPYMSIKIICDIGYENGKFEITDYEIQDDTGYND